MLVSHGVRGFYYIPCIGSGQPRGHLDRLSVTAAWWHLSCHGRNGSVEEMREKPSGWPARSGQDKVSPKVVGSNPGAGNILTIKSQLETASSFSWIENYFITHVRDVKWMNLPRAELIKHNYLTTAHLSKICWSIRFKLRGPSRPFSGQRMAKHLFVFNLKEIWKCAEAGPIRQPGLSLTGHSGVETTAIKNCHKILQRVEVLDKCIG